MTRLPYRLDRTIVIQAPRETVFSFFTQNDRWAAWWGPGSTIEPKSGGRVYIRHPNGIESSGEIVEVLPPARIVFTYGFVSGTPIPPGGSLVTIELASDARGTRLQLSHDFPDAGSRDEHVQGWRFQLSLFGNVVADVVHANAAQLVDAWLAVWSETTADARARQLAKVAAADVQFKDRYALLEGIADLVPHIGAAQRFMPEMRLERNGDVRHCQGTVLVDWVARGSDGQQRGSGINAFTLRADGLIQSVTGFWNPPPQR